MKKFISILVLVLGFAGMSIAQTEVANSKGSKELAASKSSGTYSFVLPSRVSQDDIDKNMKYYKLYMDAAFNANSHEVLLTLSENSQKNRYVVARFLTALKVTHVKVDGENMVMDAFIKKYLE